MNVSIRLHFLGKPLEISSFNQSGNKKSKSSSTTRCHVHLKKVLEETPASGSEDEDRAEVEEGNA